MMSSVARLSQDRTSNVLAFALILPLDLFAALASRSSSAQASRNCEPCQAGRYEMLEIEAHLHSFL